MFGSINLLASHGRTFDPSDSTIGCPGSIVPIRLSLGRSRRVANVASIHEESGGFMDEDRDESAEPHPWPAWARIIISLLIAIQLVSVAAGALGEPPSSIVERSIADLFVPYYNFTHQGASYRFYAPIPAATPVVTATLKYRDGREETLRIPPRRSLTPRLRFQRRLALANHLLSDVNARRRSLGLEAPRDLADADSPALRSVWGRSYARSLCHTYGCSSVSISIQEHRQPYPQEIANAPRRRGGRRLDLADEAFASPRIRVGEYSCDEF